MQRSIEFDEATEPLMEAVNDLFFLLSNLDFDFVLSRPVAANFLQISVNKKSKGLPTHFAVSSRPRPAESVGLVRS